MDHTHFTITITIDNITLEQVETSEDYDFFNMYNANDIPDTDNIVSEYFTCNNFNQKIGQKCINENFGCLNLNCQSINAHWASLKHFLHDVSSDNFMFDVIGLTELFRFSSDVT